MNAPAPSESPKARRIVDAARAILRDEGARGLSMRGVAVRLGISLSNVQYYFRARDDLLRAVVDDYLAQCLRAMEAATAEADGMPLAERRERLLRDALRHGHEMTEMCRIFRELWSLAAHDEPVEALLDAYYAGYAASLATALVGPEAPATLRQRAVLLVLPFVEGYSVAGRTLEADQGAAVDLLVELLGTLDAV
ncbi:MAG: TetR/AcrR family transcriptional regulator [Myxococcota bacterium]